MANISRKRSDLSDAQKLFVRNYVRNGANAKRAAIAAGYSEGSASAATYHLLRNPLIQQEIRKERERELNGRVATLALGTMEHLMVDEQVSPAVRFQAARWTLEAAGHNSKQIKQLGFDADKPLTEMSLSELQAFIAAGSQAVETMKQPRVINADGPQTFDNAQDNAQSDDTDELM